MGGWIGGGFGGRGRPLLGASHTGAGRQTVNKYAAIVYIRLNASMNKQK